MINVGNKLGDKFMDKYILIKDVMSRDFGKDWFQFKENWFETHGIGECIPALSNSVAICREDFVLI